jgi:MIP family channel proteins
MMERTIRGCVAEFIGTFALVLVGCGSAVAAEQLGASGLVPVALAHGLVLMVMVTACLALSGSQFNPAVSIALAAIGEQSVSRTGAFILAQLIGAAAAAGMLAAILGDVATSSPKGPGATVGTLTTPATIAPLIGAEALQTFGLMFVIAACIVDPRPPRNAGLWVGGTVAAMILAFGPLTGASMNPARSFGPALLGGWDLHWAYWVGPVAGACAGAWVWRLVWKPSIVRQPPGQP